MKGKNYSEHFDMRLDGFFRDLRVLKILRNDKGTVAGVGGFTLSELQWRLNNKIIIFKN